MNQKYESDDHSRYAGPQYLDRLSLSDNFQHPIIKSDAFIYDEVKEALLNNSAVNATRIVIAIDEAVVTLTGRVENRQMKKEVEMSVEGVRDVRDVFNLLTLNEFSNIGSEGLIKNQSGL